MYIIYNNLYLVYVRFLEKRLGFSVWKCVLNF